MIFSHLKKRFSPLNISLQWVLIVPFVGQILISVGLVGYLSYRSGESAVEILAHRLMEQATGRIHDHLNTSLALQSQAVAVNYKAFQEGRIPTNDRESLRKYFWEQINLSPFLSSVEFTDAQRNELSYQRLISQELIQHAQNLTGEKLKIGTIFLKEAKSSEGNKQNFQRRYYLVDNQGKIQKLIYTLPINIRTTAWYQLGRMTKDLTWSEIFVSRSTPILMMKPVVAVYDRKGKFQGIFSNSLPLSGISTFLSQLNFSPAGKTFIIERSGDLVATSTLEIPYQNGPKKTLTRLPATASRDPYTKAIGLELQRKYGDLNLIQSRAQLRVISGKDKLFVEVEPYRDQCGLDWLLVTAIPESDFMAEIYTNNRGTIFLCSLALLIAVSTGSLTAHWIAQPILFLNRAAKKLTKKNFVAPTITTPVGELRELTNSFTEMAENLEISFTELANQKAYLASLLETLPVGVAIHDPDGNLTYLNDIGYDLLGTKPLFTVSRNQLASAYRIYRAGTDELYPTEELPAVRAVRGESCHLEDLEIARGKTRIVVEARATPVLDQNDRVIFAIVVFEDITERQAVSKILSDYNQKLEQDVWKRTIELEKEIRERQEIEAALRQAEVELRRANRSLEYLVNTDGLTQIANRRCFDNHLEREWRANLRDQLPLALIMIDIDYFKGYNDHYGHQGGDDCLIKVANALEKIPQRSRDLVARYGGEEFAVILPNTDCVGALTVAESVQKLIESLAIPHAKSKVSDHVTLSLGVASLIPTHSIQTDDLIARADQALYAAKQQGRNRVIAFPV